MKNIIESQITDADRDTINDALGALEAALAGKTGTLTPEERTRYGSINEQNKLIVNKARDYHLNQPATSAPDVDWTEFEKDYQARVYLETCINRLKAILHALESTKIMHDYDNFQDALKDYGYSQYRNGGGESDYKAKVDEFKQFFAKSNKNNPPEEGGESGSNP